MTLPHVKRVSDSPAGEDGMRIPVDRLWPRGVAKDTARIDLWLKDLAPSHALRKRFHGHPDAWNAFQTAYAAELAEPQAQAAVRTLDGHMRRGQVTLLYAARDQERNNAIALRAWLADNPGAAANRSAG